MEKFTYSITKLSFALVFLLAFAGCKKSPDDAMEKPIFEPLYSGGFGSSPTSVNLGYDVVINRTTTFQNGLTQNSPGWKKLEALPETESYTLQVNVSNGNFYMLKDNIVVQSLMNDQVPLEERVAKVEVANEISTSYDYQDNTISTVPTGDLSTLIMQELTGQVPGSPVDTNLLNAQDITYTVNSNTITIVSLIAQGDDTNSTILLNKNTGQQLLLMFYNDSDPSKLEAMASFQYDSSNHLQFSTFTFYDYLSDGDVKHRIEKWTYSNYSLTFQ